MFFSLGTIDKASELKLFKSGIDGNTSTVSYSYLREDVPEPFRGKMNLGGGPIKHIVHHKFVVCGFNGQSPVVFCGSWNSSTGGEARNGDNLIDFMIAAWLPVTPSKQSGFMMIIGPEAFKNIVRNQFQ